jgi:hypothetical protein
VAAALRPIYTAATEAAAAQELDIFEASKLGHQVPGHGTGVAGRLAAVHSVPGVPAGGSEDHLHHKFDRVFELSAAEEEVSDVLCKAVATY